MGNSSCTPVQTWCLIHIHRFDEFQDVTTVDVILKNGGNAIFVQTDLSKLETVEALVQKVVEMYGRIDLLFNFAGVNPSSLPLVETPERIFDLIYQVNVKGCFFLMQHVLRQMVKQEIGSNGSRGKIVNITSINGLS